MVEQQALRIRHGVEIPVGELTFHFTRSSGPGGQHVNKAATQAELCFDVARSPSLSEEQKRRALSKLHSYVSREGLLRLSCQSTRSQQQNREEAVERFVALMRAALEVPKARRRTRPSRASRERRIVGKQRRSALKRLRGRPADGDP
jgi:ribosome-associated protein